jgi:hypothetical protein
VGVLGIGTGEFIMECSSDSFRCEGLTMLVGGSSVGLEGALEVFVTGVEGFEIPCADIDGRLASAGTFTG